MNQALIFPATSKGVVNTLMVDHQFTTRKIARRIGVNCRTVSRVRQGAVPSDRTRRKLFCLIIEQLLLTRQETENL